MTLRGGTLLETAYALIILLLTCLVTDQADLEPETPTWERNGEIYTVKGLLANAAFRQNLDSLYDTCGNYRLVEGYDESSACASAQSARANSRAQAATGDFWYSQAPATPDGLYARSLPGKPWIRQTFPYTCLTNPYNECPYPTVQQCKDSGCLKGKKVGSPIISPNGGQWSNSVLVSIDVEGLPPFPSTLPSAPILPKTTFQNGVCAATCEGKPMYPACNDKLQPVSGIYGTKDLGGVYRSDMLQNPCMGATVLARKQGFSCRCNPDRLLCDPQNVYCTIYPRQCGEYEGASCRNTGSNPPVQQACGPAKSGGLCAFGTWQSIDKCIDDLTPAWPDSNFQEDNARTLVSPRCRNSVCSDHSQCIHIYYTLDGTTPTRSSRLYHGPFVLDTVIALTAEVKQKQPFVAITVKAIAVQEGNLDSDVVASPPFNIKSFVSDTGIGHLWAWGYNVRGQLGLGDGLYGGDPRFPYEVPGAPRLVSPSFCLDPVTGALLTDRGCDPTRWVLTSPQPLLFNSQLSGPALPQIAKLAAGAYHNLAITQDGRLMSWGWNGYGQLGQSANVPTYALPAQHAADNTQRNLPGLVEFNEPISRAATYIGVSGGSFHSGAIDADGRVYTFGVNYDGQLCTGDSANSVYPRLVKTMPHDDDGQPIAGARWVQIALGQEHTILLASNGHVYACGSNRVYQLGRPRFTPDTGAGRQSSCIATKTPNGCPTIHNVRWTSPIRVLGNQKPLQRVVKISAGVFHSLALTADGEVYAWGDNRMNQLGQGPLVNRGGACCGVWVPLYRDNQLADVQPDGGPGGQNPGSPTNPQWPWPGFKVLDIAAGAHFSLAVVVNISGPGCSDSGQETGHRCVKQDWFNGMVLQDWDVPRNVDIDGDHFRSDALNFTSGCPCQGGLHPPGGMANCDLQAFATVKGPNASTGLCHLSATPNVTVPCHYMWMGACSQSKTECRSQSDCPIMEGGVVNVCDRLIKTCSAACPCADRSCPAVPTDASFVPKAGDPIDGKDWSWYSRAVKQGKTCGCQPGFASHACHNWRKLGVLGAMDACCTNHQAGRGFSRAEWDAFNKLKGNPMGYYGECPDGDMCTPALPDACLRPCAFPAQTYVRDSKVLPLDGHPVREIGNKQTCSCYANKTCVGGSRQGLSCQLEDCGAGAYCTYGGGILTIPLGSSPIFWGDCNCRNATEYEWQHERWSPPPGLSDYSNVGNPRGPLPAGLSVKVTLWNSNRCPYVTDVKVGDGLAPGYLFRDSAGSDRQQPTGGTQWAGPDCLLVKLPFPKLVFGWGDTRAGQLSRNIQTVTSPDDQPVNLPRPTILPSLTNLDVQAIVAGSFHAAVVLDPQPHDPAVCNLSAIDPRSAGVGEAQGGRGAAAAAGMPFYCDGRPLYAWGGNTEGELGLGLVSPTRALDCVSVGNVRVPCENVGGAMRATRLPALIGRNVSTAALGFKHSVALLGDCPATSVDRCGVCRGDNSDCVACDGRTNSNATLDWCGLCGGDNATCSGCLPLYGCQEDADRQCADAAGNKLPCSPAESYHPCLQGRKRGSPCCLDLTGMPSTPEISDPRSQAQGRAPGTGPVPCSHFGAHSWRDAARASNNYCGLVYDECSVCDGDHTRCVDCLAVPNGRLLPDVCGDCGGLATGCIGCDGQPQPDPARRAAFDACERCQGDNSTCSILLLAFNRAGPARRPPPLLAPLIAALLLPCLSFLPAA